MIKTSKVQKSLKPPKLPSSETTVGPRMRDLLIRRGQEMSSFYEEGNPWTKYKQLAKEGEPGKVNLSNI